MVEPPSDSFHHAAEEPVLFEMHDLTEQISFLRDNFGSEVASKIYNLFKGHIANIQIAVAKENSKLLRGISEIFKESSQCSQDEMEHITQSRELYLWENQGDGMEVAEKISTRADRCTDGNAHVDDPDLPAIGSCRSSLRNNCDAPDGMDPEAALENEVSYVASMSQKKESIHVHNDMAQGDHKFSPMQGSNSRKRKGEGGIATKNPEVAHNKSKKKLDHEHTLSKRQRKYSESEADDWFEKDESMQSDNEEKEDEDEEADGEEDDYDPKKVKASKKFSERKGSTAKRKVIRWDVPVATVSKYPSKVSSSPRSYTKKKNPGAHARVFSGKSKSIVPKRTTNSEKETSKIKSSGKTLASNKEKSAEAEEDIPSNDDLRKAIVQIVNKVDHTTTTFSDMFKMLDDHYMMDLSSRKSSIKLMIQDELTKYPVEAD
ncbi:hypothetical protein ACP70R_045670 [Stipagrostis hirtigluma subsp. patula]